MSFKKFLRRRVFLKKVTRALLGCNALCGLKHVGSNSGFPTKKDAGLLECTGQ